MAGTMETTQVGQREMLADYITIVDAKDKPLLSMIPKSKKLTNTLARWQVDSYDAVNLAGQPDGQDATDFEDAAENRGELQVYCHYNRRTAKVSKLAEDVSVIAGAPEGEFARSITKKLEEIGRDIEAVMGSDNATQADTGVLGYETAGLGTWINATAYTPVDVTTAHPPSASIDATAAASLTEATVAGVLQSVFQQSGKRQDLDLVCGPDLKRVFTGFTQVSTGAANSATLAVKTYNTDTSAKKIVSNIMVYEGDFNTIRLHPSLLLAQDSATANVQEGRGYVLDMNMLELRWNQMPKVTKLPDLGGGPRAIIEAIWAMIVKNPKGLGKFAPTS